MIQAVRNAFNLPDLRRKILYTFLIMAIYRLASHVPVPGVNQAALKQLLQSGSAATGIINILDLLSGGAISNFSVLAMGVYPYITASIIVQLLIPIIPYLENLQKEGEAGRNKINQFTVYATIPLAAFAGHRPDSPLDGRHGRPASPAELWLYRLTALAHDHHSSHDDGGHDVRHVAGATD